MLPTLKIQDWAQLSPHFAPTEVMSPDTINAWHLIDVDSITTLNAFREALGFSVMVNSALHQLRGLRSAQEQIDLRKRNKNAAELSLHVAGKAFDISAHNRTPEELATFAKAFGQWGAIGIYPTFIHVDRRPLMADGPVIFYRH